MVFTVVGTNLTVFGNISIVVGIILMDVGMISFACVCFDVFRFVFDLEEYVDGCQSKIVFEIDKVRHK